MRVSGVLDGYYSLNLNHPVSRANQLRNFDVESQQFSLNMARLTAERAPAPFGFRVDLGVGKAFDTIHAAEAQPEIIRFVQQAFASFEPAGRDGLRLDFGKFVTSAGAEVIETLPNWNYSRSLLFSYAIPYYHFGLRLKAPLGDRFAAGLELVNGWNCVRDNNNGKTLGVTATVNASGWAWTQNYYYGPEKSGGTPGRRQVYDTTLSAAVGSGTNFYLNFDYGRESDGRGSESQHWLGAAAAARFALHRRLALAPRLEWFRDADGFTTGLAQRLKEVTVTGEWRLGEGAVVRLEYRRDWSDRPFFDRGAQTAAARSQQTLLAGLIFCFACEP